MQKRMEIEKGKPALVQTNTSDWKLSFKKGNKENC